MYELIDLKRFLKKESGYAMVAVAVDLPGCSVVFNVLAFVTRFENLRGCDLFLN